MFPVMRDVIFCALIASLTLAVPVIGYVVSGDTLLQQSKDAVIRAQRFDAMARSVEDGKVTVHKDSVATSLRHYAIAERALSGMHAAADSRANVGLLFMAGVALCQFALLALFIARMRRADPQPVPFIHA